jgi:hypothetical protein
MSEPSPRRSLIKRILLAIAGLVVFTLVFVIAVRLAVDGIYRGIEANKATGLAAISPFSAVDSAHTPRLLSWGSEWISKSAAMWMRTSTFDDSVRSLNQVVVAHHGYLEDLHRQSHSGYGRTLSASVSVPSSDYETALADLKILGRVESIAEEGEDSAVKIASASRHLAAAQTNLSRLQKLQRERKGDLRDAVALEKDISQANEALAEAERQNHSLLSTVSQAHISVSLVEDYQTPLQTNLAGLTLQIRNSFVEGLRSVLSSIAATVGVLFEYGLPLLFWSAVLFLPVRLAWRRIRRVSAALPVVQ